MWPGWSCHWGPGSCVFLCRGVFHGQAFLSATPRIVVSEKHWGEDHQNLVTSLIPYSPSALGLILVGV